MNMACSIFHIVRRFEDVYVILASPDVHMIPVSHVHVLLSAWGCPPWSTLTLLNFCPFCPWYLVFVPVYCGFLIKY